jgi:zinc transport system substrate-binding protein
MADNVCKGLIAVDPEHGEIYDGRRYAYRAELEELDRTLAQIFASKTNRRFITYHPAWGWLARDYGLEQIAIEVEGKEPTVRGIEHLIMKAKQLGIRFIFVSPQFSANSAEVIAREIGGAVVHADPLARNYIENIKSVATALGEAME